MFFKATASPTPKGNYNVAGKCDKGHTSYKKAGDNNTEYKCPHNCGRRVH